MMTADEIKELRSGGLSPADIAAQAGLTRQVVYDVLNGRTRRPGARGRPLSIPLPRIRRARAAVNRKRDPLTKIEAAEKYKIGLRTLKRYFEPGSHPLETGQK